MHLYLSRKLKSNVKFKICFGHFESTAQTTNADLTSWMILNVSYMSPACTASRERATFLIRLCVFPAAWPMFSSIFSPPSEEKIMSLSLLNMLYVHSLKF